MEKKDKLPLLEDYIAFQDEGLRVGVPTYFIKLLGCNIIDYGDWCSECENRYINKNRFFGFNGYFYVYDIVSRAISLENRYIDICITEEPTIHKQFPVLVRELLLSCRKDGYLVVRTNGTNPKIIDKLYQKYHEKNHGLKLYISLSPKRQSGWQLSPLADEYRLVIDKTCSLEEIKQVIDKIPENKPIIFHASSPNSIDEAKDIAILYGCEKNKNIRYLEKWR